MANHKTPARAVPRQRAWRWRPRLSRLVVTDEHALRAWIGDGIVRKWREPVFPAVFGPRKRRSRRGDDGSECRVGDDVGPRQRRLAGAFEDNDVLTAVDREASEAVAENLRRNLNFRLRDRPDRRKTRAEWRGEFFEDDLPPFGIRSIDLVGQSAAVSAQYRTGDAGKKCTLALSHPVAAQQIHSTRAVFPRAPWAVVEQGRDVRVGLVEIADRMLIQDDNVRAQTLQPPVSLRFQDLADEAKGILFGDSNQDDRQVARDAVRPQGFLAERVVGQYLRACTERPVHVQHP